MHTWYRYTSRECNSAHLFKYSIYNFKVVLYTRIPIFCYFHSTTKKKKAEHPQTKWKHKKAQNKVESKRKVQINCEVQNSNDSESAGTKNRKHTQGDTRRLWSRIR